MEIQDVLARIETQLKVLGLSADKASTLARKPDAIRNMRRAVKTGDRVGVSTDTIGALAPILDVSPAWLLTGQDQPERTFSAPVMGLIGAGAEINVGVEQVPPEGFYDISTVVPLPADVIAFEVTGESMYPRYDPGDVVICHEKGQPIAELPDGIYAAVLLEDGRRFLKKIRREPAGTYTLESHNAPPIFGVHITWAADILATIPATRWSKVTNGHRRPRAK